MVIAGAGSMGIIDRLCTQIKTYMDGKNLTEEESLKYIESKCLEISNMYSQKVGSFEIIVVIKQGGRAKLYNIVTKQGFAEPINTYIENGNAIQYGALLLKRLWKNDMNMLEFAELAVFIIKLVIDAKVTDSIGGKPDIYFIPNESKIRRPTDDEVNIIKTNADEKLASISKFLNSIE